MCTGTFFESFRTGDWRLHGLDTSPSGLEVARLKYGAQLFCGSLRVARYPAAFFEVVAVMDALYYCQIQEPSWMK